jgi:hypothetical protein
MFVTTPPVAWEVIAEATCAGDALGWSARYNAAAPATKGEAMEVPLSVPVEESLVYVVVRMLDPGANRSRQVP